MNFFVFTRSGDKRRPERGRSLTTKRVTPTLPSTPRSVRLTIGRTPVPILHHDFLPLGRKLLNIPQLATPIHPIVQSAMVGDDVRPILKCHAHLQAFLCLHGSAHFVPLDTEKLQVLLQLVIRPLHPHHILRRHGIRHRPRLRHPLRP